MNHPLPEDAVAAAAIDGLLLVVATSETVDRYAPAWAATAGQYRGCYRVLVIHGTNPQEAGQIVAEANSLAAAGIVAVGTSAVVATATAAGRSLGLPVVAIPFNPLTG